MSREETPQPVAEEPRSQHVTKKNQILALYLAGIANVEDLATMTNVRPSYVATVLQQAGFLQGYFDLYTSTAQPMNVYSKLFASQLGFKDVDTARHSVAVIDRLYTQFEEAGDRAGQHHALSMALVMFDRARWTGKTCEADILLNFVELGNTLHRAITVAKARGSANQFVTREFTIGQGGSPHLRQDKHEFPLITCRYAAIGSPSCWLALQR